MTALGSILDGNILSEQQLLDIYNAAVALVLEGKTIMSYGGEGTNASRAFVANPMDIAKEARYALKQKWPKKYGYIAHTSKIVFI